MTLTPKHVLDFVAKLKYEYALSLDAHREKSIIEDVADLLRVDRVAALSAHNKNVERISERQSVRMSGTTLPGSVSLKQPGHEEKIAAHRIRFRNAHYAALAAQ